VIVGRPHPETGIVHAIKRSNITTYRHGQRRGRCAAGPLPRARPGRGRGYIACLATAGADLRARRLARACGFKVIAAGKGTRYEPHYHKSNPQRLGHPRQIS
jgi:hypothetical protein